MPTYHYKCKACDHEFEEFQSMSDEPLVKCPKCGKKKLVRLITGAGLVFKGSGFYLTDYKKSGASPREHAPEPSAGESKEKKSSGDAPSEKPGAGKKEPKSGTSGPPKGGKA